MVPRIQKGRMRDLQAERKRYERPSASPATTLGHGGGGDMGERIRGFDWSKTPLGPITRWPQSLRTVVNILLSSRYAMWMAWGRN